MKNAKTSKFFSLVLVVIISSLFFSCQEERRESPTQGNLTMISSEDVFPVIALQVQDFMRVYPEAKITHLSSSTRDAIVQLLNDSVALIVSPRDFNAEEKQVIEKNELDVTTTKIAYDAVAVIVNSQNAMTRVTVSDLKDMVTGKITRWSELPSSGLTAPVIVAMGEPNSAVYEYVKTRIAGSANFAPVIFPCSTSAEVISLVQQRRNAVGFVAQSWLSQVPDGVRILEVGDPNFKSDSTKTEMEFFAPHQAHIYRNYYPLSRSVYVFTHNAGRGVALGFAAFSAGTEGQKIIVKNGLVPAVMPVRLVQLNQQ